MIGLAVMISLVNDGSTKTIFGRLKLVEVKSAHLFLPVRSSQ